MTYNGAGNPCACCNLSHLNTVHTNPEQFGYHQHLQREDTMGERMRVAFPTEEQATAFIQGVEYLDDDHVMTEGPEADLDSEGAVEYAVYVRRFA
jgi:hypothetical protein